jgi:hypothetical protein
MTKFSEPLAQKEYERLVATGMDEGDAHEDVERRRLRLEFVPKSQRLPPQQAPFCVSNDRIRNEQMAALQAQADRDPDYIDSLQRSAKAAGASIAGKTYNSGLAAYPGDPDAWVRDESDVRSVCKHKGYHVSKEDGVMKIGIPMDPTKPPQAQLLKKPRIHKPTYKQQRPVLSKLRAEGRGGRIR